MIFVSFVLNCLLISLRMKNIFSLSLLQFPKLSKKTQNFSDVHTLAHAYFIFASRAVLLKSKRRCIKENPDTITVNTQQRLANKIQWQSIHSILSGEHMYALTAFAPE
jgi:hypothetical protein